jgi:hypothetical protein
MIDFISRGSSGRIRCSNTSNSPEARNAVDSCGKNHPGDDDGLSSGCGKTNIVTKSSAVAPETATKSSFASAYWSGPLWKFASANSREPVFGSERGECIDRYYIEKFLAQCAQDIHGSVLEIANNAYTMRFGGDRVIQSDVLHVQDGNPRATIVDECQC